jgi:hypothetical protein
VVPGSRKNNKEKMVMYNFIVFKYISKLPEKAKKSDYPQDFLSIGIARSSYPWYNIHIFRNLAI